MDQATNKLPIQIPLADDQFCSFEEFWNMVRVETPAPVAKPTLFIVNPRRR